jgi:hypothetical protein
MKWELGHGILTGDLFAWSSACHDESFPVKEIQWRLLFFFGFYDGISVSTVLRPKSQVDWKMLKRSWTNGGKPEIVLEEARKPRKPQTGYSVSAAEIWTEHRPDWYYWIIKCIVAMGWGGMIFVRTDFHEDWCRRWSSIKKLQPNFVQTGITDGNGLWSS